MTEDFHCLRNTTGNLGNAKSEKLRLQEIPQGLGLFVLYVPSRVFAIQQKVAILGVGKIRDAIHCTFCMGVKLGL
jgi:hypothetical protein